MSSVNNSICRSCRLSPSSHVALRLFSTSAPRGIIPPESPNYVDIPHSYQSEFIPPKRPKGTLPVPREIFPARQPDKPSKEYLSRLIPPQRASTKPTSKMSEQDRYKARMTELRRQHLRSGLLELYNRKQVMTQQMAEKSTRRQNERARLMSQPPREDERLTNTSIPSSMRIGPRGSSTSSTQSTILHDRSTAIAVHALKTANLAKQAASKTESRRDALHTLYMHARSFITTEAQLAAEIERVFDHPEHEWSTTAAMGSNIWNRESPATVAELLSETPGGAAAGAGTGSSYLAVHRGNTRAYRIDQERMKKLAEALSGGKI